MRTVQLVARTRGTIKWTTRARCKIQLTRQLMLRLRTTSPHSVSHQVFCLASWALPSVSQSDSLSVICSFNNDKEEELPPVLKCSTVAAQRADDRYAGIH